MSDSNLSTEQNPLPTVPELPVDRERGLKIRPATLGDLPFIDSLQKKNTKQVGWFPTKTIEGKISAGHVLIAEESGQWPVAGDQKEQSDARSLLATDHRPLTTPLGYCISRDQYFKRDDVGIIYQINIAEGKRRGLIGAALLKAQFDRSAYGCKLYCCWCAQDIEANHFWEALGFVPLAYRAGSEKKQRVHIFWCKRIRQGDTTTPWWFPSQTMGGSMMQDRLVFPIPPGTHWSDAKPIVLPQHTHSGDTQPKQIEDAGEGLKKIKRGLKIVSKHEPLCGGLKFRPPAPVATTVETPKREKKAKIRNDPRFVSAARELRDRWLERVNSDPSALTSDGKYDVRKALVAPAVEVFATLRALPSPIAA